MKGSKTTILTLAEKCKSILASNWQAQLNTIKADAKGSKESIYTSKVKYILKKGKPYLWVNEKDMHNVNTIIDDRASLAVASPFPGPLANLFKSMQKLPARIAITGNVEPLKEEKARLVEESLKEVMLSEQRQIDEAPHTVSSVLSSSNLITTSRSENLKELLDGVEEYGVYRFNLRYMVSVFYNSSIMKTEHFKCLNLCRWALTHFKFLLFATLVVKWIMSVVEVNLF
ncbi:hypothetical protein OIU84_019837 [Salix udensis]|uniref:CREG-like beta-barrel domain-containing protein n=1 Tax=Salix udensis TaxID=889485 RepID=A0AAD6PJX5_9ROSI|nr:hypothetical protein OIU84_019837 [Salix udensis]